MTTQYKRTAAYDVINYLWARLTATGVLDETDYFIEEFGTEVVPIIPVQNQPEFANILGELPYLVYEYILKPSFTDNIFTAEESLIFTIYCPDQGRIMEIFRVISEAFRALDESAKRLQASPTTSGKYFFNWTTVDGFELSGESDSESGRGTGEAVITYSFGELMNYDGTLIP